MDPVMDPTPISKCEIRPERPLTFDCLYQNKSYRARLAKVARTTHGISPADVEDVLQETYIIAHLKFHTLGDRHPMPWLFSILKRVCWNFRRRRQRQNLKAGALIARFRAEWDNTAYQSTNTLDMCIALHEFLDTLPQSQRDIFVLKVIEGYKTVDVSKISSESAGTLGWRVREANQKYNLFFHGEARTSENGKEKVRCGGAFWPWMTSWFSDTQRSERPRLRLWSLALGACCAFVLGLIEPPSGAVSRPRAAAEHYGASLYRAESPGELAVAYPRSMATAKHEPTHHRDRLEPRDKLETKRKPKPKPKSKPKQRVGGRVEPLPRVADDLGDELYAAEQAQAQMFQPLSMLRLQQEFRSLDEIESKSTSDFAITGRSENVYIQSDLDACEFRLNVKRTELSLACPSVGEGERYWAELLTECLATRCPNIKDSVSCFKRSGETYCCSRMYGSFSRIMCADSSGSAFESYGPSGVEKEIDERHEGHR